MKHDSCCCTHVHLELYNILVDVGGAMWHGWYSIPGIMTSDQSHVSKMFGSVKVVYSKMAQIKLFEKMSHVLF